MPSDEVMTPCMWIFGTVWTFSIRSECSLICILVMWKKLFEIKKWYDHTLSCPWFKLSVQFSTQPTVAVTLCRLLEDDIKKYKELLNFQFTDSLSDFLTIQVAMSVARWWYLPICFAFNYRKSSVSHSSTSGRNTTRRRRWWWNQHTWWWWSFTGTIHSYRELCCW